MRVSVVQIGGGQQTVVLGSHVTDLNQQIIYDFSLDCEIVLIRVLGAQMRLKLAVEQNWPKSRPVDRLPAWRVQNAIEGIRILCSVLADKRRVEQNVCKAGPATGWRPGAELLQHQLPHRVLEEAR